MPGGARYEELKAVLRSTAKAFDKAETDAERLDTGLGQLRAVILYLQGDDEVAENYLMRPLGNIENALHDAGKGASPALLNHEPTASKPTDTTRENVQAMLAIAVDLLMAAQIGKDVAIRWIARECRVQGAVDVDGGAITTKQINGWRTEIKKQARILAEPGRQTSQKQRAPVTTAKEYADLKKLPEHAAILKGPHDASKRQHAEARARALIRTIAALMPRSAPRQQRRASGAAHDLRDPCRLSQTARAGRF